MDCTIYVAKTKSLISCAVSAQLISIFVFAYAKSGFSHDAAQILSCPIFDLATFTYKHSKSLITVDKLQAV